LQLPKRSQEIRRPGDQEVVVSRKQNSWPPELLISAGFGGSYKPFLTISLSKRSQERRSSGDQEVVGSRKQHSWPPELLISCVSLAAATSLS
jgi:hypothetical protein